MKSEYDFSGGIRGKHYKVYQQGHSVKINHPDGTHTIRQYDSDNNLVLSAQNLPTSLLDELDAMKQATDDALWIAINPSVSPQQRERLAELNALGGEQELTPAEYNEQETLLMVHHRSVLRRAKAIAVLTLRGYSISDEQLNQSVI